MNTSRQLRSNSDHRYGGSLENRIRLAVEVTRAVRDAGADFVQRLKDGKEIADINFEMLQPKATITNELAWRKRNAA